MIALKTIFLPSFYLSTNTSTFTTLHHPHSTARRSSVFLCLCSPTNNSNDESDSNSKPEGDVQSQELLAQIAMIQTQKVRLTDFLDERSEYLTQFGEEAKAEIDKIGEDALQGLDEASDRITANIESQMLAFEEFNELNKQEIEESESKVMEIEGQMEVDRNEGMFFKSLGQKGSNVDKAKAKQEVEKMKDETKEKNGRKTMKNVSLFFIGLLTYGIVGSINFSSLSSTDWKRVVVLGAILVALFSQFIYEQNKDNNQKDDEQ
ncbi:uncharacterized protein LOC131606229 [Vicia villosa]|uniref:uncharacterized protein LOC131606229 n=1 Tax=Vicia villosa TaxID=3911 RepID=UPI00273C5E94|nr:uncharacterized protein LOC131606229 [Vicia villosa]